MQKAELSFAILSFIIWESILVHKIQIFKFENVELETSFDPTMGAKNVSIKVGELD